MDDAQIMNARSLYASWSGKFIVHVERDPEDGDEYLSIGYIDMSCFCIRCHRSISIDGGDPGDEDQEVRR